MPRTRTPAKGKIKKSPGKSNSTKADTTKSTAERKRRATSTNVTSAAVPAKKEKKGESSADVASTSAGPKAEIKTVKFTGAIPIDEHCKECQTGYHVFGEYANVLPPQDTVYNAMLNQTNIGENNNKYYVMQLLKHDTLPEYVTWFRWGRVGKIAGTTLKRHGANISAARDLFTKKFREKTGTSWWFRRNWRKTPGKYDLIEMDFGKDNEKEVKEKLQKERKKAKAEAKVESRLEKRVQDVIDMIFDVKEFEACVKEMEFDVKKAPLGKLTAGQIKAGYETLKEIEKCIQKKQFGKELEEACSQFYTRIPHDFGMKRPPLIKTHEELKQKIQLLEALGDIQIAVQLIEDDKEADDVNIRDRYYESLECQLVPLKSSDKGCKLVKKYVENSHGSTHRQYRLTVEDVFELKRETDEKRFKKNIGNRMLLWHGSRLTNWCGILSKGLRIAPPEAPVSGYMFGKGVYFADMVSKSANYCRATRRQPKGFLLLCEVALGQTNDKLHGDYFADRLPKGKSSTKGVGREVPNPKGHTQLPCGTMIPLGKPVPGGSSDRILMYNEYIVYDVAQIKPRYLVKVKFGGL